MELILISMGVLGVTGFVAAVLLYVVSQLFKVEEDPRIDLVQAVLPGANCGGCGFAGCRNFAEACVKAGGIEGLSCPVGGEPTMDEVKRILTRCSRSRREDQRLRPGDRCEDQSARYTESRVPQLSRVGAEEMNKC